MLRHLKRVFSDKLNIAYAVLVSCLIGISIYSVYSVIYSFLFDNTTTTVTVGRSANHLSFADGLSVHVSYKDRGMIFPETWSMNKTELKKLFPPEWSETKQLENSLGWNANNSMTLTDRINVASATAIITSYDLEFLYGFTDKKISNSINEYSKPEDVLAFFQNISDGIPAYGDRLTLAPLGEHSPRMIRNLNKFLHNPSASDLVEKTISQILGPKFALAVDPETKASTKNIPVTTLVDSLTDRRLEVFIPFDFLGNTSTKEIEIELIPFNTSSPPVFHRVLAVIAPFVFNDQVKHAYFGTERPGVTPMLTLKIELENTGIFDSTNVRTDCAMCENFYTIEHCEHKCLLDSVVRLCACVPFSYRKLYPSQISHGKLPFCTPMDYARCFSTRKFDPSECRKATPCVMKQNFQKFEKFEYLQSEKFETENNVSYRFNYVVSSEQRTFVQLKENFQNTWMEMLGQMGGNLGVFLSFSLLGLWQFSLYLYSYFQQQTTNTQGNDEEEPTAVPGTFMASWMQMARLGLANSAKEDEKNGQHERMESRLAGLEEKSEILVRQGEDLEDVVKKIQMDMKTAQEDVMLKLRELKDFMAQLKLQKDN